MSLSHVCLNINHYHTTPAPPLSLTALPAFLSPLFVHVHVMCMGRYTSQPNHYTYISIRQPWLTQTRLEIIDCSVSMWNIKFKLFQIWHNTILNGKSKQVNCHGCGCFCWRGSWCWCGAAKFQYSPDIFNLCQYNNFLNCIPFICSLSLLSYSSSTLSSVSSSSAPMSSIFSHLILPSASSFSVFLLLFGLDSSQC